MRSFLFNAAQVFGIVLLADFIAGVIHWLEDAYGTEHTPVVGPLLIRPNIVHHHFPRFFTKLSWWQSSWDLVLLGAVLLGAAAWWGVLSWQLWLFVAVSINANQVHKWAHRTRAENGKVVSFLQDIRVLQTPRQHALHHTDPKNTYYCPITNVLNPVLEWLRFWDRAEWLIERATGIAHRHDTSNRGAGPGPEWLAEYRPLRVLPSPSSAPVAASASTPAPAPRAACHCAACPRGGACARSHAELASLRRAA
jgi:plasmanylethanolamine desaturase